MQASAQDAAAPADGIIIGGAPRPPATSENCVEVEIGGQTSFGCFNQKLKKDVDKINPSINLPPIDAKSGDTRTGIVNLPGVQQQYGQSYGRSVVPYRPAAPNYGPPAVPRR
jgi:hypothetical protein